MTNFVEFAIERADEMWFIPLDKGAPLALYVIGEQYYGLGRVVGYCAEVEEVLLEFEMQGGRSRAFWDTSKAAKWTSEKIESDSNWGVASARLKKCLAYDDFKGTLADGRPLTTTLGNIKAELDAQGKEMVVVPRKFTNVEVTYSAEDHIILPKGMTYKDAREWLTKKERESEKEVGLNYTIEGYPVDAALAFYRAVQKTFGFTSMMPTPGFWGPTPPMMIGVQVSTDTTVQIPWGSMQMSGIDGRLETAIDFKDMKPTLLITGSVKQKHKQRVDELVSLAKMLLKNQSIYKGQAIKVNFEDIDPKDPRFDPLKCPKFMDLSKINPDELVFSTSVQRQIEVTIWTPIKRTQMCRDHKIPLRRGALLAGKYGTGKTLAAQITALHAIRNGWTYIYLENVEELPQAIHFAKLYAPAVVFAEDINRITDGERDANLDKIFNTLDGVDTKHSEVMVIFTTNNIEDIHPGMMRPGRVDTIIEVAPPDAEAAIKLVNLYGRGLVDTEADLTHVGEKLAGNLPAVIREVVERSKLAAVSHLGMGEKLKVGAQDLEDSADAIAVHRKFIEPEQVKEPTDIEVFGNIIGSAMQNGLIRALDKAGRPKSVKDITNGLTETASS